MAAAGALLAALAGLFLLFAEVLPGWQARSYDLRSLEKIRSRANTIKAEFSNLLKDQNLKLRQAAGQRWPETIELRFRLFKRLNLDPETEGIAAFSDDGKLTLWLGNVLNLEEAVPRGISDAVLQKFGQTLLIKDKASSYLVSLHWVNAQTLLVLYRLLAFIPKFQSPYLEDYHFIPARLRADCSVDYFDFREDISVFDKLFSRHRDEYVGQPSLKGAIQSLTFPLRNERNQVIARVTLRSPAQTEFLASRREFLSLFFYVFLGAALLLFLMAFLLHPGVRPGRRPLPGLAMLGLIVGLRALAIPWSRLSAIQSLDLFSPTIAGFFSAGDLTKSPGDILLTAACLFAIFAGSAYYLRRPAPLGVSRARAGLRLFLLVPAFAASSALLGGVQTLASKAALHSSLNLLNFSLTGPFIALHLGLGLAAAGAGLFIIALLKRLSGEAVRPRSVGLALLGTEAVVFFAAGRARPAAFLMQLIALAALAAFALVRRAGLVRSAAWAAVLLQIALIFGALEGAVQTRSRSLMDRSLKATIETQEDWARFVLDQSFQEIDRQKAALLAFLRRPAGGDEPAAGLWGKTLAAKFNWYSSLEIQDPSGSVLSRFSLNVPAIFRDAARTSPHPEWTIARISLPFLGKSKDFLIGTKDWTSGEQPAGRTVFSLALDDAMLPFLYSANPYFELLRVNSLPSLEQFDLRLAVFDGTGKLLFNPGKLSTGLPPVLLDADALNGPGMWTTLADKGVVHRMFVFRANGRVYAIFSPRETVPQTVIEFFKLLILDAVLILAPALLLFLLLARKRIQHPLWSFANRVYVSFIAVALVPLFVFTFFSRSFFTRIFTQQFIEKAEIHASMARSVMDDYFVYLSGPARTEAQTPPEDLMLWISTTIANDVNLYQEGRLVSSSRQEFFDNGLFPDLIDGEIYYKIQFENNPFYTQTRSLGQFAFQTLTVPYAAPTGRLMISLPFPFEQQEIRSATQDLIEFFLFISVFLIATVLILARGIGAMIVRPITRLLAGTKEASLGNLDFAIEYGAQDEMKTLVDGFNAMIRSLRDHQRELADLGKKAAWAEMARKVAHEIKNPLTPIQLSAEHLLRVYEDKHGDFEAALRESISYIISEVENLRRIAQEFLEISKEAVLHKERFDFDELLRETVAPYKTLLAGRIRFEETFEGTDFALDGDRAKLKTALRNLLTNAIESIRGKGEIRVRIGRAPEAMTVVLEDTGSGIEQEILDRIFEPYFSTKDIGTGLGLPIAKKIIEDHRGTIEIASEPGKGTRITVRFRFPHN
jgi:signal transduction histidine kinase